MRHHEIVTRVRIGLLVMLFCLGSAIGYAAEQAVNPELEAKTGRVRAQQSQQITQAQREASAAALKAQKAKIQKAKEAQQTQSQTSTGEKSAK